MGCPALPFDRVWTFEGPNAGKRPVGSVVECRVTGTSNTTTSRPRSGRSVREDVGEASVGARIGQH